MSTTTITHHLDIDSSYSILDSDWRLDGYNYAYDEAFGPGNPDGYAMGCQRIA